jgi:hypothetical protein
MNNMRFQVAQDVLARKQGGAWREPDASCAGVIGVRASEDQAIGFESLHRNRYGGGAHTEALGELGLSQAIRLAHELSDEPEGSDRNAKHSQVGGQPALEGNIEGPQLDDNQLVEGGFGFGVRHHILLA